MKSTVYEAKPPKSGDGLEAKVGWQFTSDDARIKLKCLDPTLDE